MKGGVKMEIIKYILTAILVAPVLISTLIGAFFCIMYAIVILLKNERFNNTIVKFFELQEKISCKLKKIKDNLSDLENIKLILNKYSKRLLIFFIISYIVIPLWTTRIKENTNIIISIFFQW